MGIYIGRSKKERRATHWNEIRSRVKTHEGELLSGNKGRDYQKKWSKKYLGKDLNNPLITKERIEEYEKTKK